MPFPSRHFLIIIVLAAPIHRAAVDEGEVIGNICKSRGNGVIQRLLAAALHLNRADWRASGAVVDSGTITHDGDSVDVLVTVSESSAAFYRDMPEQVLFDSVSFPVNIPDAEEAFHAISFDDIDGDGESDVLVRFLHKSGDTTEMIWIWDPVERYVFREDLSTVAVIGDLADYVGLWAYQGENLWLRIHGACRRSRCR